MIRLLPLLLALLVLSAPAFGAPRVSPTLRRWERLGARGGVRRVAVELSGGDAAAALRDGRVVFAASAALWA